MAAAALECFSLLAASLLLLSVTTAAGAATEADKDRIDLKVPLDRVIVGQHAPAPTPLSEAERAWAAVKDSTDPAVFEAFIKRYGDTFYGDLARVRLDRLKRDQPATAVPNQSGPSDSSAVEPAVGVFEQAPTPRETFRDCPECPEMVAVPPGSFTLGSPESEVGRDPAEGPQREVTIAKPFAVGRFEVTFAEWDACAAAGGCKRKPDDMGWGRGRQPVINVSWQDAKRYVAWLSRKSGKGYRLLTEAEWEYAARAGTATPFSTGRTITTDQANFNGSFTYGESAKGQFRGTTVAVGSFKPNGFGLHDMHGNVWEWAEDCWIASYTGAPADGAARTTMCADQGSRVLRGGSWINIPESLRSALRDRSTSEDRSISVGFRVARTLGP